MKTAIDFGYQFPTHLLLMWTLVVQFWIVPVYNEHTGGTDCFHQLENRLVALEHLVEFLYVTINADSSFAGISLPSLQFQLFP
jgi:hypothetical protein